MMEKLIESVRKYPCLWKKDSEEYKLVDLKEAAWIEVVKECHFPDAKEARAMWKKLRDGHRQALAKKKTTTGQGAISKSLWKYEKQMEFLLPSTQNRKRTTNMENEPGQNRNERDEFDNEESSESALDLPYGNTVPPKKKTTLISVMEKEIKRREERSNKREEIRKQILTSKDDTSPKSDSDLESFFKSMLLTAQTLPENVQVRVQRKIFDIIMEAKEDYMTINSTASSVSNYLPDLNISNDHNYSQQLFSPSEELEIEHIDLDFDNIPF